MIETMKEAYLKGYIYHSNEDAPWLHTKCGSLILPMSKRSKFQGCQRCGFKMIR